MNTADTERARADWSRREVALIVADYLSMLADELAGRSYSKRAHNDALRTLLPSRSRGSIEFKHQNISAVLINLGYPYIEGYKPRRNFQDLLRQVIEVQVDASSAVNALAERLVSAPVAGELSVGEWSDVVVEAPVCGTPPKNVSEEFVPSRSVNYLEREARNASLGSAGEHFVLQLEHQRLWARGERRLANKIEHVAQTRGDGLGYDILSYEEDGRERLIEVKTTRFGNMTPFFATRNEVDVSGREHDRFHLYRVFRFSSKPKVFVLRGYLHQSVILDPIAYRAALR